MSMRLQELHPSLVHFPIALLPTALAADALGRLTGRKSLMDMGRRTMPVAAASAVVAGLAGLVAQESVKLDEESTQILITHRNLNLGLIGMSIAMAVARSRRKRPSRGYLAAGFAGMAAMSYSAYLGGHMVYEHGVGVKAAGGVNEERAPELIPANAGKAMRLSAQLLRDGARTALQETEEGKVAPWLTGGGDQAVRTGQPTAG